ncbi:MAG TPA: VOC family protein [Caulobacteraceae bacterium]|jgi:PhnB protein|nr:VOC family protein [Caulobacteraceae bacterium]
MVEAFKLPPMIPAGGITPYLTVPDGKAAIAVAFYTAAFGAVELFRNLADDGERIMHSRLLINDGLVMLADDFPEYRGGAAMTKPNAVSFHLQVDDADAWWSRAIAAGARVKMPMGDMFWDGRYGQLTDPFGHSWSIAAPL